MMTCKQVSALLAKDGLTTGLGSQRLGARLHLMMCDDCTTFRRWMDAIVEASRALAREAERETPADLDARTLRRLDRSAP